MGSDSWFNKIKLVGMSHNHSVSDLLIRIKNGYMAKSLKISSPSSKLRESILKVLKDEGYILSYSKTGEGAHRLLSINLRYHFSSPVVSEVEIVSKPGKRVYSSCEQISAVKNGLGTVIMSTSAGILTDYDARLKGIGGEVLFKIF